MPAMLDTNILVYVLKRRPRHQTVVDRHDAADAPPLVGEQGARKHHQGLRAVLRHACQRRLDLVRT